VDVEDYFQVEAFSGVVHRAHWNRQPSRVEHSTEKLLDLLDSARVKGTFFVLGWVAKRFPRLVQRISAAGHEIASHGCEHQRVGEMTPATFREDAHGAKDILEGCTGRPVVGYRAPTFSITARTWWAYEILAEAGYAYSSSIYPIAHDLYGMPSAPRIPFSPVPGTEFLEIPIATVRLLGRNGPCGGGGYFRLLPYQASRWLIARVNKVERRSCVFYCHPWEFDTGQPYMSNAPLKSRFRHYLNIDRMEPRVRRLLHDFRWGRMDDIFLSCTRSEKAAA
jgi:polysaccharide deacetylase family protein (PEP-CTERM system associated)